MLMPRNQEKAPFRRSKTEVCLAQASFSPRRTAASQPGCDSRTQSFNLVERVDENKEDIQFG